MTPPQTPLIARPSRDPKRRAGRRRLLAISASLAAHLLVALALAPIVAETPPPEPSPPVLVTLTRPEPPPALMPAPTPGDDPGDSAPAAQVAAPEPARTPVKAAPVPTPAPPQPRPRPTRPAVRPPPAVPTVVAAAAPASAVGQISLVGEARLAGALTAGAGQGSGQGSGSGSGVGPGNGAGPGGGACDMVQRLQTVLRRDPGLRATALQARSTLSGGGDRGALLVWDGDWLRNPGQEGKGLAGLRQAIAVEVAFAPAACRNQSVDGLVLIHLGDGPGDPRLALGAGRWRWSDLLGL